MLKGTTSNVFLNNTEFINNNPLITKNISDSDKDSISVKTHSNSGLPVNLNQPDTPKIHNIVSNHDTGKNEDSIFASSVERKLNVLSQKKNLVISLKDNTVKQDTVQESIISGYPVSGKFHRMDITQDQQNIYKTISCKNITNHYDTSLIKCLNIPVRITEHQNTIKQIATGNYGYEGKMIMKTSIDWLPIFILISLFMFSLIKVIFNKYILQVLYSLVNYQASVQLLRDRNVLFRNMAFVLNIIFALNTGLFVYFFIDFFKLGQINQSGLLSFLIYAILILAFYNIRFIICKTVGYIFLVNETFEEYNHNEKLSNKNIGLLLFPVIILIPYVPVIFKPLILYLGIAIVFIIFILRIIRAFQIIIRKEVSSFYLILYLCTIEILPILFLVKYS